ncbi:MAG TPA: hypothetical protein VHS59_11670 [Bacillota bacterium]|nr:hypothetical protein [Bacillota bacterium]
MRKVIPILLLVITALTASAATAFAGPLTFLGGLEKGPLVSSPERLQVTVSDVQTGFQPESVVMFVDGAIVFPMVYPLSNSYVIEYIPGLPFPDDSSHEVSVYATDAVGETSSTSWTFRIASPPVISNLLPRENSSVENDTNSADISFHVHDDSGLDPLSIKVKIDDKPWAEPSITLSADEKDADVTYKALKLIDGLHTLDIQASDIHGNPAMPIQWTQSWGYQFFWHFQGVGPYDGAVYNFNPPMANPPDTVSPYLNESEIFRFSATSFFRDGFGDAYKPSFRIYYPNQLYPYQEPTLLHSISPAAYTIFNNNHEETASEELVLGSTVPGTTRKFIEGLYKIGVNFINVTGAGTGLNYWKVNLISGYPKAQEIYPESGAMVVSPSAPTVSVRAVDPGYGPSGIVASYLTLSDNGISLTYPTKTQINPTEATITQKITTTGLHNIEAGLQDKAKNSATERFTYYYKTQTGTGPVFVSVYPMDYNLPGVADLGFGELVPDAQNQVSIKIKVNDSNLVADNDNLVIKTATGTTVPFTRTFSYGSSGTDQANAAITYTFTPPAYGVYNFTLTVRDQTNVASTLTSNFVVKEATNSALTLPGDNTGTTETVSTTSDALTASGGSTPTGEQDTGSLNDLSQVAPTTDTAVSGLTGSTPTMSATAAEAVGVCQTCHTRGLDPAQDFKRLHFLDQPQMTGSIYYGHAQRCYGCHQDIQLRFPNNDLRNKCQLCHNFGSSSANWNYFQLYPGGGFFDPANTLGDGYNEWPWDLEHGQSLNWSYSDRSDASKYSVNAPREELDCIYCHQNNKSTAGNTPVAGHDLSQAHIVELEDQQCTGCHSNILTVEHAKPGRVDKDHDGIAINCNTCHKSTRTDVTSAVYNYSQLGHWNYMADTPGLIAGNLNNRIVYESPEYSLSGKQLTKGTLQISSNDDATWFLKAYYDGQWHTVFSTAVSAFKYQYPSYVMPRYADGLVNWPTGSSEWVPMTSGMSPWMKYQVTFPKPVEKIKYVFTLFRGDTSYRMRNIVKFTDYEAGLTPSDPPVTCNSCHTGTAGHLESHKTSGLDARCQTCHKAAITEEHLSNSTTSGKNYDCNTCHASILNRVNRAIAGSDSNCAGCHTQAHNHNLTNQAPADIPLYTGFKWSTPLEAGIFAGEDGAPVGYQAGQVIISNKRADVLPGQIWEFYNSQLTSGGLDCQVGNSRTRGSIPEGRV